MQENTYLDTGNTLLQLRILNAFLRMPVCHIVTSKLELPFSMGNGFTSTEEGTTTYLAPQIIYIELILLAVRDPLQELLVSDSYDLLLILRRIES